MTSKPVFNEQFREICSTEVEFILNGEGKRRFLARYRHHSNRTSRFVNALFKIFLKFLFRTLGERRAFGFLGDSTIFYVDIYVKSANFL